MASKHLNISNEEVQKFHRGFFESEEIISMIGDGKLGGKASGLVSFQTLIKNKLDLSKYSSLKINVPRFIIISTDYFDKFMNQNNLYETALSEISDERKAKAFQSAELPAEILGDLRTIISNIHTPLAIRSSSMLEDSLAEPFAGVYSTKMIANHEPNTDKRFQKFVEAIKFVYASTFFNTALQYFEATKHDPRDEKMAVIIQVVVGSARNRRYYPAISGVARSYNFYPIGSSKSEDGVVNLALGLGKTIVDGGISWTYSPKRPKVAPPFADPKETMKNTQTKFWAVNLNPIIDYDPVRETEYLTELTLEDAEYDSSIDYTASTYDAVSNKLVMGTGVGGARVLNFARLLKLNEFNFNSLILDMLKICEDAFDMPIEIEFAFDFNKLKNKYEFAPLQVRPMNVSSEKVEVEESDLKDKNLLVRSTQVLGNGEDNSISDIIFVDPHKFESKFTKQIAKEIEVLNKKFVDSGNHYVLIGFGRWGSSDEWLGVPIEWSAVSRAKVIVESSLPNFNIDFSQGSHFFHNITAFGVIYFSVKHDSQNFINWEWLSSQNVEESKEFVKHVRLQNPLHLKVDGRKGIGVIKYG